LRLWREIRADFAAMAIAAAIGVAAYFLFRTFIHSLWSVYLAEVVGLLAIQTIFSFMHSDADSTP
jgi:hypothetical protein